MASWIRIRIRNSDILSRGSGSVRKYLRIWNTAHEFAPNAFYTKLSLSFSKGSLFTVHFPYLFQKGPYLLYIFLIFSKWVPIYCTLCLSFPKEALSRLSLSFPKEGPSRLPFSFPTEGPSRLSLSFQKGPYLNFPYLF